MNSKFSLALCAFLIVAVVGWKAGATNQIFFGDPLAGLNAEQLAQFDQGKDEFSEEESVAEGLGPVFNGTSCSECHSGPAIGGDSDINETRFGRTSHGQFDPMAQYGGSLIQSRGIGSISASCNVAGETVPAQATIVAQRKTTPLFGLGLVDHVPDLVFVALAQVQKRLTPQTTGRVNWVTDLATGRLAVGKFGWKGQNPNLKQFAADAYLNEMGITTPTFPNENCPQGNCAVLTACDMVKEPEDDGSGVQAFTDFMTLLAPPPRAAITRQEIAGEQVFLRIGCANCHLPVLETARDPNPAFDRVRFFPYSDFLLHDMGNLGDGIEQGGARGQEMRTAPLWGLRVRNTFLHDGRAANVSLAILAHAGQGSAARQRFNALTSNELKDLLAFLNSL